MLEDLWRRQVAFTAQLLGVLDKPLEQLTEDDRTRLTSKYIEALHSELVEVLNTRSWKSHRFNRATPRDELLSELVDVQKYLWGLMVVHGVTPAELERAFNAKSDIVEQRFRQEHILPRALNNARIVAVDLDDTVVDWETGFAQYCAAEGYSEHDVAKHVDPALRMYVKAKFYQEHRFATLEAIRGAVPAVKRLIESGHTIVWLSARPVDKYPGIVGDTVQWLRSHDLPMEYLYWSDLNKHLFILEKLPTAVALFDNETEIVGHAKEFGVRAYLVTREESLAQKVEEFLRYEE